MLIPATEFGLWLAAARRPSKEDSELKSAIYIARLEGGGIEENSFLSDDVSRSSVVRHT